MSISWLLRNASVIGTSHMADGSPCQDRHLCRECIDSTGAKVLLAVVADGAGSAPFGDEGAELLCRMMVDGLSARLGEGISVASLERDEINRLLDGFHAALDELALTRNCSLRDFACTLAGAVVGQKDAVFFQVGDSAIVYLTEDAVSYCCPFWPQKGEYENTTVFATGSAVQEQLQFLTVRQPICAFSLFTDGLIGMALHNATKQAYSPFFEDVFALVKRDQFDVADFLQSAFVNRRTDDDKTLILALRQLNEKGDANGRNILLKRWNRRSNRKKDWRWWRGRRL
jgi:hypothetical protein